MKSNKKPYRFLLVFSLCILGGVVISAPGFSLTLCPGAGLIAANANNILGWFPMSIQFQNTTGRPVNVQFISDSEDCKGGSTNVPSGKTLPIGGCSIPFKMGMSSFAENHVSSANVTIATQLGSVELTAKVPGCWGSGHPSFSYSVPEGSRLKVYNTSKTMNPFNKAGWNPQGTNLSEDVPFYNVVVSAD